MAHLSARHEDAVRRRGELLHERARALAIRTGYPVAFQRPRPTSNSTLAVATPVASASEELAAAVAKASDGVKAAGAAEDCYPYRRRYSPEEIADSSRRCEQRVALVREAQALKLRQLAAEEQQRKARSQLAGEAAPAQAARRLREHRERRRRASEAELDALVAQQDSSLEAMNIARLLSPRFQEHVRFEPAVAQYSPEDQRIKQLLASSRVGEYYQ